MRRYNTVIFDLDGTLLDTLADLADSVNHALTRSSLPCRGLDEVRRFVGNGVSTLISRAVPAGTPPEVAAVCLADFQAHYLENMEHKTAPYPGVLELLERLRGKGVGVAVVSNKFDGAVKALCPRYFGDLLPVAVGESPGTPKKPAPDMVFQALAALGVPAQGAVYVGDSDVDIDTARSAGMPCISVTWGFRERTFLESRGARLVAETMEELELLLDTSASVMREAQAGDLAQLLALYGQLKEVPLSPDEQTPALWARMLETPGYHVIVAEDRGRLISSCALSIIENLTHGQRPYALVENVVTDKALRGQGLGTACLRYAEALARRANCYKLMLMTGSKRRETLAFYERAGYRRGEKTAFIQWI